jgi:hypothetical protein
MDILDSMKEDGCEQILFETTQKVKRLDMTG